MVVGKGGDCGKEVLGEGEGKGIGRGRGVGKRGGG